MGPVNPWEVGVRRNQLNDVFSAKALLEALSKYVMYTYVHTTNMHMLHTNTHNIHNSKHT